MLSRHFLRAKALQTLYAGVTNQTTSADEIGASFDYNVGRLNNLGFIQLSTLMQLAFTAARTEENEALKFNPQAEELDRLHRWANNRLVCGIERSFEYRQLAQKQELDWSSHFDIFRKILNQFKSSKQYADYMAIAEPTFADDQAVAVVALKHLMTDDSLHDLIAEHALLWDDDYFQIAQYVLMLLKEQTEEGTNEAMRCPQVYDPRNEKELNDYNFARQLAIDTFRQMDDVEPLLKKHLQNWELERVALIDLLLINMAVTEFTCCPSIPERVTVDEYIELSKEFSTEKSKLFINGILDKLLIELRVAGKVEKNERGLYDPELDGDTPPEG
ncbi:MAG: transcription antitermination factor NusB [Bacteroidales bacterium]|nr:transcription antitermination factor NusB [Bacteroidales bacterium]